MLILGDKDNIAQSLTIYKNGDAVITEIRKIDLCDDITEIMYKKISDKIQQNSLSISGVDVNEVVFQFTNTSFKKQLKLFMGKEVISTNNVYNEKRKCTLLSLENNMCLLLDKLTNELYLESSESIILAGEHRSLHDSSSMLLKINKKNFSNSDDLIVTYMSSGFIWSVDYIAKLKNNCIELYCWVTIINNSGIDFTNTSIELVYSDMNRVTDENPNTDNNSNKQYKGKLSGGLNSGNIIDDFKFNIPFLISLKDDKSKLINIINGLDIKYSLYYKLELYRGSVSAVLEIHNTTENNLGCFFPKGKIKIYRDSVYGNSVEFLGEDVLNTAKPNELIKLSLGASTDLSFINVQNNYTSSEKHEVYSSKCVITNHKSISAVAKFTSFLRENWTLIKTTHNYNKLSMNELEYTIDIPANSTVEVEYEYKTGYFQ